MSPVCQWCEANGNIIRARYAVTVHLTGKVEYACHNCVGAAVRSNLHGDGEHVRVEKLLK